MNFCKRGFTLMELMIVITIIGVLAVIAVPSYRIYVRRAHYTELIQAAAPYKLGVEECYQATGMLNDCRQGANGVPPAINLGQGAGLIGSITVAKKGMIKITPQEKFGIAKKDTYVLTPSVHHGVLVWHSSGGGIASGYAN